jgi:hypothetical protein
VTRVFLFLKLTALFTLIDGVVSYTSFAIAFSQGMYRFDHPDVTETYLERVCAMVTSITA